jgi:hypothetical protein
MMRFAQNRAVYAAAAADVVVVFLESVLGGVVLGPVFVFELDEVAFA